jgi:uncharacterized protein (TIGR02145 family)
MKENLNTTHYRNGEPIPEVADCLQWINLETGAYCNYNNDETLALTYGKLYNFYTVVDERGLCPTGWHVPSEDEWFTLFKYLDPAASQTSSYISEVAGAKMKATGTIENGDGLWDSPNSGATDESGFTGLPGGCRTYNGPYSTIRSDGFWRSTTTSPFNGNDCDNIKNNNYSVSMFYILFF